MKELEISSKDNIAIINQKEVEKKHTKLFSILLGRSHKLWKMDIDTLIVEKVELAQHKTNVVLGNDLKPSEQHVKVDYQDGFLYCSALNKKNAYKHFAKQITMLSDGN
jgi:hypothetical protein